MLSVYDHYHYKSCYSFSAAIDFRRQNLTSKVGQRTEKNKMNRALGYFCALRRAGFIVFRIVVKSLYYETCLSYYNEHLCKCYIVPANITLWSDVF